MVCKSIFSFQLHFLFPPYAGFGVALQIYSRVSGLLCFILLLPRLSYRTASHHWQIERGISSHDCYCADFREDSFSLNFTLSPFQVI